MAEETNDQSVPRADIRGLTIEQTAYMRVQLLSIATTSISARELHQGPIDLAMKMEEYVNGQ